MKRVSIICFILISSLITNAQVKNSLLEASFWKGNPDLVVVKSEIKKGNDPAAATSNAFDVVTMAINNDASNDIIKYLIEQPGNDINKSTHDNRIYLHWAANRGNAEIVNYLIQKGSDINFEDSHAATPIMMAANSGQQNTGVYEAFFKAGLDPKKKYTNNANLLLLAIANDPELQLTNYLITKNLSLKDTDKDGNTAFDYVAKSGNIALLKQLLTKGVKPTNNALLFAAQGTRRTTNTLDVYKYLVEDLKIKTTSLNSNGQNVLHILANKPNQLEIINYFITKNVDANLIDKDGNTPLHIAASSNNKEVVDLLLQKSKNINLQNKKGESALTFAIKSGSPEIAQLLISKGANAKIEDKDGNNLGVYLIQSFKPQRGPGNASTNDPFTEKINILKNAGLNIVSAQKDGSTLYHLAVIKNDLNLLKKLESLQIDINAKNSDGLTALHKAAMIAKDDKILKYIITMGAKKEIGTDFDETAFDLATENEFIVKDKIDINFLK